MRSTIARVNCRYKDLMFNAFALKTMSDLHNNSCHQDSLKICSPISLIYRLKTQFQSHCKCFDYKIRRCLQTKSKNNHLLCLVCDWYKYLYIVAFWFQKINLLKNKHFLCKLQIFVCYFGQFFIMIFISQLYYWILFSIAISTSIFL